MLIGLSLVVGKSCIVVFVCEFVVVQWLWRIGEFDKRCARYLWVNEKRRCCVDGQQKFECMFVGQECSCYWSR